MPSPIAVQAEELKKQGYPVKNGGIRKMESDSSDSPFSEASNIWLHRWAKHACQNYPIVSRSVGVRFLKDACRGIPAFVVGIGPSLDDNIEDLKSTQGRAVIIATDASLRPLLAKGIKPHIVINFDCQKKQASMWEQIPDHNIPLIANSCTHPDTIKAWKGPLMFYNQWHDKDMFISKLLPSIYPHIGQIASCGTVGNMGILLAHIMGCKPIYTVGMDLCYQENGKGWQYRCLDYKCHAGKLENDEIDWWSATNKILYDNDLRVKRSFEEEIGGQTYRTDPELKNYREGLLGIFDALQLKIQDCSVNGVLKHYFNNPTVTEAIFESCKEELSEGRSALFHMEHLIPDGRKRWEEDSKNGCSH